LAVAQTAPESEEWIFTLTSSTGELLKVEKLDRASGERKELSDEEYTSLYVSTAGPEYAALAGVYGDYSVDPYTFESGYYQGLADYEAALNDASAAEYQASLEQHAYYQGIADYGAALTEASVGLESPAEQAYYQGMADYAAAF
jgi:hypothetical protein